jgi:hypothetical protein
MKTRTVELNIKDAEMIFGFLSDVPWEVASTQMHTEGLALLLKIKPLLDAKRVSKLVDRMANASRR